MTLSTRHRTTIHQALVPILGEDAAEALMAEFPASEHEQLVTREHLRAELGDLRTELRGELGDLRTELRGELADLRGETADLRGETTELRTELRTGLAELRTEMAVLRADLHGQMNRHLWAVFAAILTALGIAVGLG